VPTRNLLDAPASSEGFAVPTRNLLDWIALNLLPGLGPVMLGRALKRFGDPGEIAYRVPLRDLECVRGVGPQIQAGIADTRRTLRRRAERELRRAEKLGLRVLVRGDAAYPAALSELPDAPILLYLKGSLPEGVVRLAVVGSRQATLYGRRVATGLAADLATRGIEIVSGGARGIDTCAHEGALNVDGRTVAVLGSGFRRPYPEQNAELFDRIATSGALLSEFPLDVDPKPENFPRRNRVISGLSAAVVVVEAARRSRGVAFLPCHPERTETAAGELPEGASDPRRPPQATQAQAWTSTERSSRALWRPPKHGGNLGAEPEDALRPSRSADPRVPRLLPLAAWTRLPGAAAPGTGGSGAWPA
jgi:DNA protecting protein DprA